MLPFPSPGIGSDTCPRSDNLNVAKNLVIRAWVDRLERVRGEPWSV